MMKFVSTISLNFEIYFLDLPQEIVSGVISGNYLYLKLLENAKKGCNILTIILVQGFCPLKVGIAQFPIGFCLEAFEIAFK